MATVSPGSITNETSRKPQSCEASPLEDASPLVEVFPLPDSGASADSVLLYANQTWSNSILPGPVAFAGCGGLTTSGGVSSSLNTRSLDAMAACRMLYL